LYELANRNRSTAIFNKKKEGEKEGKKEKAPIEASGSSFPVFKAKKFENKSCRFDIASFLEIIYDWDAKRPALKPRSNCLQYSLDFTELEIEERRPTLIMWDETSIADSPKPGKAVFDTTEGRGD